MKRFQRVPLGQASPASQTWPDLLDLEVFGAWGSGRLRATLKGWGSPSAGCHQRTDVTSFMPHPTSFLYLLLVPLECVSGGNFLMPKHFQTNHPQLFPCRNFRLSRGWVTFWCVHKISLQAPVQTIQQWTEVISVKKHTKYTHKSTCQALVLACWNCELSTCPARSGMCLIAAHILQENPDKEQEDTSQILTNYTTNCLINESLWMTKHYFQAVLRKQWPS